MPPPKKHPLAERIPLPPAPNPLTPTLAEMAPWVRDDPLRAAQEATRLTNQARSGTKPPVPVLVAGVSTEKRKEPLAIRLLRIPTKPADAANAFMRRLADEGRYGHGPAEAVGQAAAAARRALVDLDRDVPPTAVRATLGVKAGQSSRAAYNAATVLDYILGFKIDPTALVTGPVGKVASKIPAVRAVGSATRAAATKAKGTIAQGARSLEARTLGDATTVSSRAAAATLGVGPAARMMREVRGAYEPNVARRFKQAEAIVAEMRAWTLSERRKNPAFSRLVEGYQTANPGGVDPLTDAVRMYVRAHRHKGKTAGSKSQTPRAAPALDAGAEAAVRRFSGTNGIPYSTVRSFGDRIIAHGEETLSHLRAVGDRPFTQARGFSARKPLPPSANFPNQAWTGVHRDAGARAEDRLRSIWFGRYLEDLLPHSEAAGTALHTLGPPAARAARGKHGEVRLGVQAVRRAGVRDLVQRLEGQGGYLKRWTPGAPVPEGWVVVTNQRLALPTPGAAVPMAREMDFLKDRMMPRDLYNYLAGEMAQFIPTVTKAGRSLGVEGPILQSRNRILSTWTRVVGTQKRTWLTNPATFLSNTFGNHLLSEIALARHGGSQTEFAKNLAPALKEAYHFERTAQTSPDIDAMSRFTRAFGETIAEGAGVRPGQTGRAAAGAAGKRVQVPGVGGVIVPQPDFTLVTGQGFTKAKQVAGAVARTAGAELERAAAALGAGHGLSERTYKLALYKTLQPKLGRARAAKVVEDTLFNYADRPALLEAADRYGLVIFNAFPVFATRALFETLSTRPDLVAKYPRLARLSRIEAGAQGAYEDLEPEKQTAHLAGTGEERFLEPSRYFPLAGGIDFLSRPGSGLTGDQLAETVAGGTAFGPVIEQAFNQRLLGGVDNPWRIVPRGVPPPAHPTPLPDFAEGVEGDLRAREFLSAILPGIVRGAGRVMGAREGIAQGTGRTSEAQAKAEALLAAVLGIRTVQGEPFPEKDVRTMPLQQARDAHFLRVREQVMRDVPDERNPYTEQAGQVRTADEVDRALTVLDGYVRAILPQSVDGQGRLTEQGARRLTEAALWEKALLARMRQLSQGMGAPARQAPAVRPAPAYRALPP